MTKTSTSTPGHRSLPLPFRYYENKDHHDIHIGDDHMTKMNTNISVCGGIGDDDELLNDIKRMEENMKQNESIKYQCTQHVLQPLQKQLIQIQNHIGTPLAQELLYDSIPNNVQYQKYISFQNTKYIENTTNEQKNDISMDDENKVQHHVDETCTKQTKSYDNNHHDQQIHQLQGEQLQLQRTIPQLKHRINDLLMWYSIQYYIITGTLLPYSLVPIKNITEEQYIISCCIDLCNWLCSSEYLLGFAILRDVQTIKCITTFIQTFHDCLVQYFVFRNNVLRRKFDTMKYCIQDCETILYELAITSASPTTTSIGSNEMTNDIEQEPYPFVVVSHEELQTIATRLAYQDELRELLIKKSRDGQKAAKNAIFALHRSCTNSTINHNQNQNNHDNNNNNNLVKEYEQYIQFCEKNIREELYPIIQQDYVSLRYAGSFTSVLEEYVEAKLFKTWLYGNASSTTTTNTRNAKIQVGTILSIHDLHIVFDDKNDNHNNNNNINNEQKNHQKRNNILLSIEPNEYLGGLCDLTGEIGRYAVTRGTVRDVHTVQQCLHTNQTIYTTVQSLQQQYQQQIPNYMNKKIETLQKGSIQKLRRMLYEMSLSEATGRNFHSNHDPKREDHHDSNNDHDET